MRRSALEFSELLVASKGETLVFGDLITDGADTFCYLKAKTLKRANMPGSGSAHLLTPFEALFIQPQSCCVTSLQAFLISVLAFLIFSRGL